MKIASYSRVSTTMQDISIEMQRHRMALQAEINGDQIIQHFEDFGISGKNIESRPGLQAAIAFCKSKQADALMIYKLDRLGRNLAQTATLISELDKAGIAVISIAENINSSVLGNKLVLNVLLSIAEHERLQIGSRVRDALAELRRTGKRASAIIPWGYRLIEKNDNRLEIHPEEKQALVKMIECRNQGLSWEKIATELNDLCIPTRSGKPWSWSTVRDIVNRQKDTLAENLNETQTGKSILKWNISG